MLSTEQWAFLIDVAKLINFANDNGYQLTGGELFRTLEQQTIYFNSGKSKTMNSNHLKRLAIDFNFFKDGKLLNSKSDVQPLGDFWESLHPQNRWGGNFKNFLDIPHFERNV